MNEAPPNDDSPARANYDSPAPPAIVGTVETAAVTISGTGTDNGIYSSVI